jgi:choline kinase
MSPLLTPTVPPSDPNHPPPFPSTDYPPTLLLRIYGPSSDALISRTEELRILHVLFTEYGLGPKVYGTFDNGRVEQFFPSRALTADELRVPKISASIAKRMRELHSVDLRLLGYEHSEPMVWDCLTKWTPAAAAVLEKLAAISAVWANFARAFDMPTARAQISQYKRYVSAQSSGVVFARELPTLLHPDHRQ